MGFYGSKKDRLAKKKVRGGKPLEPGKVKRQTVVKDGQRVVIEQRMNAAGEVKVTVKGAGELEWKLQAAQVDWMKRHPLYGKGFVFAASMEAGKRGAIAQREAIATGMMAGEPDLRVYIGGAAGEPRVFFVENKGKDGRLHKEQSDRHYELRSLGFPVHVIKATTTDEAVNEFAALLEKYLDPRQHFKP